MIGSARFSSWLWSASLVAVALLCGQAQAAAPGPGQGPGFPGAGPPPKDLPKLVKVKDDLYVIENVNANMAELGAFGGNVTVYLTDEGVILVDVKNEKMHDDILAKVRSLTDKPIKYVILTHHHGDHAAGAPLMQAMGATVIISASDRERMARGNQAPPVLPQVAYTGYSQVFLGGKEVQLREFRGHTRGDTLVTIPAARLVVAGDLVTVSDSLPGIVIYADGGTWTDLGESLDQIARMDFDYMVPGHGPVLSKAEFIAARDKVAGIRERLRGLNRERKSAEEIAQVLIREFNWGQPGPAAGNIPAMMQELR